MYRLHSWYGGSTANWGFLLEGHVHNSDGFSDIDYSGSMGEFYEEAGRSTLTRANPDVVSRYAKRNEWNRFEIRMIGDPEAAEKKE